MDVKIWKLRIQNLLQTSRVKNGTSVMISRAGDVIPQVLRCVSMNTNKSISSSSENDDSFISPRVPSNCPSCGAATYFDTTSGQTETNNITVNDIKLINSTRTMGNST